MLTGTGTAGCYDVQTRLTVPPRAVPFPHGSVMGHGRIVVPRVIGVVDWVRVIASGTVRWTWRAYEGDL